MMFQGQCYAVMGLDKSGLSTVSYLHHAGAKVLVWDDNPAQTAKAVALGGIETDFLSCEMAPITALILTPGIPHLLPKPHPVAARFHAAGKPIWCDIELFAQAHTQAKIIGITGTNGKSTTTALIHHILTQAGVPTAVGGNFGIPALSLSTLSAEGVYVLELSSYQLERCPSLAVDVGVMLNLTPDHLARHGDMAGYAAAKEHLFTQAKPTATAIMGVNDDATRSMGSRAAARGLKLCAADAADATTLGLGTLPALLGAHNGQNIMAAYHACCAVGLSDAAIKQGIKTFGGLAHRQQIIAQRSAVTFVNDSKATNADATEKALLCYDRIYWIIGGQPKETGLQGLEPYMNRIAKAYIIGQAEEAFATWMEGKAPYARCGTLEAATRLAAQDAFNAGQAAVVLLSPACASWDQFRNFEERGDLFSTLARHICQEVA